MGLAKRRPREKAGSKAGKAIAVILVVLVAYCCVYSLAARMIAGESIPKPLGFGVGVVLTGSMEPALHENSLIIVTGASNVKVGDVIVYQTGGTPVVHRVIDIDESAGTFTAQGDANNAPDDTVTFSKIKGKVAFAIPYLGLAARFIQTTPGLIMVLIVLFVLFFLSVRTREQEQQEDVGSSDIKAEIEELRAMLEKAAQSSENSEDKQ